MASSDIKIQRLLLEIVNGDEKQYKADESLLSLIINESLNSVLEEFYSGRLSNRTHTQIEKWDIELGKISWPIDRTQILHRLREQIRPLIDKDFTEFGDSSDLKSGVVDEIRNSESGSEAEILLFFLKNGYLPWYASSLPPGEKLANPELISVISKVILEDKSGTAIQRLLRQYNSSDLSQFTSRLINTELKNYLDELNQIIESLYRSEDKSQKRIANDLMRNLVLDLVKNGGRIKPLVDFIGEYIEKDLAINISLPENLIAVNSPSRTESIKKLINDAYLIYERNKRDEKAPSPTADVNENAQMIIQYLSFGSLPADASRLTKEDVDGRMTDFILKNENVLVSIFQTSSEKRDNFYKVLINLSQVHFKSLLKFIVSKLGGKEVPLKGLLMDLIASPAIANEEKAVSAGIIINRFLKQPLSIPQLQKQGAELLTVSENQRLNNLLAKELLQAAVSSDAETPELEIKSEMNAVYYSDLLLHVLQYNSWPWWGEKYVKTFGQQNLGQNFTVAATSIIKRFKGQYASEFVSFSKKLLHSSQKPSIFFSKVDWENAKIILNAALPADKVTFIEMVEALLEIMASKGSVSFEADIAVQQFVLFMLDKKPAADYGFEKLLNDFIITAAVKFNLPLWSVYRLITHNTEELKSKIGYSKSEIDSILVYTEEREERYAELKVKNKRNEFSLFLDSSDFVLISESQESSILDYLAGSHSALSIFPSAWALGQFMTLKVKVSVAFREKLIKGIVGKDTKLLHRLIELEYLSGQTWISMLLAEAENTDLQNELFELLSETFDLGERALRNTLRVVTIKEKYSKNHAFTATNLRKVIEAISEEMGFKASLLEYSVISKLSRNKVLAEKMRLRLKIPKDLTDPAEPIVDLLVENRRATEIKNLIDDLLNALGGLTDEKAKNDLSNTLFTLREKDNLLEWIRRSVAFESKADLLRVIKAIPDNNQILKTIDLIKTEYNKRPVNAKEKVAHLFLTEIARDSLAAYLRSEIEFPEKEALFKLIDSNKLPEIKEIEKAIDEVKDQRLRKNLKESIYFSDEVKTLSEPGQVTSINPKNSTVLAGKLQVLINFIRQETYFHEKEELIKFITRGYFASKIDLEKAFGFLTNQLVKSRIDTFVNANFSESDFRPSVTPSGDTEVQDKMFWWKEKLSFDVPLTLKDTESFYERGSTIQNYSTDKDKEKNKEGVLEIDNPIIFSFLNPSKKDVLLESAPFLTETEKLSGRASPSTSAEANVEENFGDKSENATRDEGGVGIKEDTLENGMEGTASVGEKTDAMQAGVMIPESINSTTVGQSTLSPSSIADIAIYFLQNLELPWWSAVKDLADFERKLQGIAISEPLVLRQKLIELTKLKKGYIENIFRLMFIENEVVAIDFSTREELEKILQTDLQFLADFVKQNNKYTQLEVLIREIISKFQSDSPLASETIAAFRKTVVIVILETVPDSLLLLKDFEDKNKSPLSQDYVILGEQLIQKSRIKDNQEKGAKLFLKGLETKYNAVGMDKGISITDNLFSIYKRKDKQPIEELINSWLSMLEELTDISSEKVKLEIVATLSEKTNEQASFIEKAFLNLAVSEERVAETQLFPFSNYLSAISQILDRLESIESRQRRVSLNLFARLIMAKEMEFSMAVPLALFFNYLGSEGVEKSDLSAIITKLKVESKSSDFKQIFEVVQNALKDVFITETYVSQTIKKIEEQSETEHATSSQIDAIVKLFQGRIPVLDKLVSAKVDTNEDRDKKQEIRAKSTKTQVELDLNGRIYIPNAGLVLLWPFLSRLFSNLKYTEKGQFIDNEKRLRAIYLSQYLVGFTENDPEYTLMLNKLICGMNLEEPIEEAVTLTAEEKTEALNLFNSILLQWKEMNNTSIENFQRTFLQRDGVMFKKDENWNVVVGKSTFDVLLLKLPWGLSMIKYPWNKYLILVEWKAMN